MIRNPNDSPLQAQIDELRQLLRANPLRSASVEKGRTRFYNQSQLLIEDGNLTVTGTADIFGVLRVVGRVLVEGLGQLVVTSLIDLLGMMRVRGGGGIVVEDGGDIVLNGGELRAGDVVVKDGKAYIGGMILDPSEHGGAVIFPNGAQVFTDGSTIQVFLGYSVVQVSDEYARLQHGGNVVQLDGEGVRVSPGAVGTAASGETVSPLGINSAGRLRRIPATGGTP